MMKEAQKQHLQYLTANPNCDVMEGQVNGEESLFDAVEI